MAHDGFFGGFHDLSWPLDHAAAARAAPFDPLREVVHVPHALMGAGARWEHDAAVGALVPSQSPSPSPSSLATAAAVGGGDVVEAALMEQLAGRLGVSVPSPRSSRRRRCARSPGDAVLTERAARLSCFLASVGKLSRVGSSQSLLREQAPAPEPAPLPGAVKQHASDGSCSDGPCRKRKASGGKSKAKVVVTPAAPKSRAPETRAKKCKLSTDVGHDDEEQKPAAGEAWHDNSNGKEVAAEPSKDYIHVRARRGQATDSHSLAERVRREKISERMKLLQDLVPGCSKVTGKAVMLDEIINYVQSLQRQVEFLSMKLSTVNPRLKLDVDSCIPKDANKLFAQTTSTIAQPLPPVYALEGSSSAFCYTSSPGTAAQSVVTNAKGFGMHSSLMNHGDVDRSLEGHQNTNPQMGSLWEEDDLQSLVLMGFRGNT
ncbi:hypothetical protein SORBI_3005G110490 [Sorghum bicolor]|uniref:Uncharacterized protein n=1 Tax=Sorghum bicolor TaxID=4558 RepID=A0A109NDS5_SORBI|nr:hypothetical protein SORBI_3005G110490 [Sorghum bicolor]